MLVAAMVLGRLLLRPVWGILMDRCGRRLTFLLAGLPVPLALFMYSQQAEPGIAFAIVCFIHGMALGGVFSTFFTYINDICPPQRRAEGVAMFGLSGFIGMAIGPIVGEWIEMHFGFICLLRVFSIIAVLTLLIVRALPETLIVDDSPTATMPQFADFRRLITTPELLIFWSVLLAFGCALAAHRTFLAPMARDYHMGALGYFFTTYAAAAILVRIFAARLPDRIGRLRVLVPAVFLPGRRPADSHFGGKLLGNAGRRNAGRSRSCLYLSNCKCNGCRSRRSAASRNGHGLLYHRHGSRRGVG